MDSGGVFIYLLRLMDFQSNDSQVKVNIKGKTRFEQVAGAH